MLLKYFFSTKEDQIDCYVGWLLIPNFPNIWNKYRCVCVCVCVCFTLSIKLSPRKKEIRCPHICIFCVCVGGRGGGGLPVSIYLISISYGRSNRWKAWTESNRIALIKLGKNCKTPKGGNIFLLSIYLILFVQSSVYLSEKTLPCLTPMYRLIGGTRHRLIV